MRWMTLAHLHLDRVASAWLIARFIDREAVFEYLDWGADPPPPADGLTLFGMPGLPELSSHDERGTCFGKLLRAHGLEDPALGLLERTVAAGVAHALGHEPDPATDEEMRSVGVALDLLGIGFGVTSDDPEHLDRALPLYDALHCLCRARTLPPEQQEQVPRLPGDRAAFLRDALTVA